VFARRGSTRRRQSVARGDPPTAGRGRPGAADLAPVRVQTGSDGASRALHAGRDARAVAAPARHPRADRGVHVAPQRLPVLNRLPRRGRGGTAGEPIARRRRAVGLPRRADRRGASRAVRVRREDEPPVEHDRRRPRRRAEGARLDGRGRLRRDYRVCAVPVLQRVDRRDRRARSACGGVRDERQTHGRARLRPMTRAAAALAVAAAVGQLAAAQTSKPLVYVLSTAGTISGRGDSSTNLTDYRSGSLLGEQLVAGVPEIKTVADVRVEQVANVSSTDIAPSHWLTLAKRIDRIFTDDRQAAGV